MRLNVDSLSKDETNALISSDKVDGTQVFDGDGKALGSISRLMIGKRSGRVEYAVMRLADAQGESGKLHPLPWNALQYDADRAGYVIGMDEARLRKAPQYDGEAEPAFDRQFGEMVHQYYGIEY